MDRRFPIVDFNPRIFSEFFGKQTDTLHARLLDGGACNSNYLVQCSKGKFVCRIHRRGSPESEKSILDLVSHPIPTPQVLWIGDGVSVMTYIEGQHFKPTTKLVREAGRMIGRLSAISFGCSGRILPDGEIVDFEGWGSFKEGLSSFLHHPSVVAFLDERTVSELRDFIEAHRSYWEFFDGGRNLVHGDFGPDNILVSDDAIVGVLDWEFAHSGSAYMDMGNLMRHIPMEWQKDFGIGLRDEGIDLPEDWVFRASLIDLASHLEFLTSNRSKEFKQSCVERIRRLMKFNSEPDDGGGPRRATL